MKKPRGRRSKTRSPTTSRKWCTRDFRGVYAEGVSDMQKELDDMKKWDMKSFTISDFNIVSVGANTIVSTYKVVVEGTYDGKDAPAPSMPDRFGKWQRADGRPIFHTNVKQEAARK